MDQIRKMVAVVLLTALSGLYQDNRSILAKNSTAVPTNTFHSQLNMTSTMFIKPNMTTMTPRNYNVTPTIFSNHNVTPTMATKHNTTSTMATNHDMTPEMTTSQPLGPAVSRLCACDVSSKNKSTTNGHRHNFQLSDRNMTVTKPSLLYERAARSVLECSRMCFSNTRCLTFSFTTGQKRKPACRLGLERCPYTNSSEFSNVYCRLDW